MKKNQVWFSFCDKTSIRVENQNYPEESAVDYGVDVDHYNGAVSQQVELAPEEPGVLETIGGSGNMTPHLLSLSCSHLQSENIHRAQHSWGGWTMPY